ncbi:MAG: thrombospondin type 3 repeat-containing protein [Patescibacteria group bacterium]
MKLKIILSLFIFWGIIGLTATAQDIIPNSITNAYRYYKDINNISISVPTVVELSLDNELIERFDFAILDRATNSFEPYFFKQETLANEARILASTTPIVSGSSFITDNNTKTYADFPLPENAQGRAQIILTGTQPITSSTLTTLLDNNVALPNYIEIRAQIDGQNRIVAANQPMTSYTIHFPQTTSDKWIITFTFGQPLRISEMRLLQENTAKTNFNYLRFLAQPSHNYRIYLDPDRLVQTPTREAGNLMSANDILAMSAIKSQLNPNYTFADSDGDERPDFLDNCISTINPDQIDVNRNGRGDACDDFDQDGLINTRDNCPNIPNRNQIDTDGDKIGDVCDNEESRTTEKYPWLPWVGIGFAGLVLIILLAITAKSLGSNGTNNNP